LITFVQELHERGITFASLNEGIDFSTATGKLQFAMLAALAEFERDRIRPGRVVAGLQRAKAEGKRLGRRPYEIPDERFDVVAHLSVRAAAKALAVSYSVVHRWRLAHRSTAAA
jgi:putative DNA-invertase from lambdoid prophage Rac